MRDTAFYDRESARYSDKRYPTSPSTYTQYFYLRRLDIVLEYLHRAGVTQGRFLEVGCADGVVTRAVATAFPHMFTEMIGVDIAEEMVREARQRTHDPRISFRLRGELPLDKVFNVVVEVGVVNYASVDAELRAALSHMDRDAHYILSIAGVESLKNKIKGEDGFSDFRSYRVYDALIRKDFVVEQVRGCGLFVPYLWRAPRFARLIQPLFDTVANMFGLRMLCHEQVYLLKKRTH